jgi:hypothetical protein
VLLAIFILLSQIGARFAIAQNATDTNKYVLFDFAPKVLSDKSHISLPFQSVNNLIIVPIRLNNLLPLNFLLDTGVKTPIITDRFYSDALHVEYSRKFTLRGAGNELPVEAYVAPNVTLGLNEVVFNVPSVLVLEEDYLQLTKQLGMPVHGIIGLTVFKDFVVKIDYDKLELTLIKPEAFAKPRGFDDFDLTIEADKPYLEAKVTGADQTEHQLNLLLDTGASHALLLHNDQACVSLPDSTISGNLGRGLLGVISGDIGRISGMSLGRYHFEDVLASFPLEESYSISNLEVERDGTIGGEFLRRFITYIDYPNNKLYLQRGNGHSDDFIFTKTGLSLEVDDENLHQFKVIDVRPNSTGEQAGIQEGDILLQVNGRKAKYLTLQDIYGYSKRRDGRKLRLKILRDSVEFKSVIILQDML